MAGGEIPQRKLLLSQLDQDIMPPRTQFLIQHSQAMLLPTRVRVMRVERIEEEEVAMRKRKSQERRCGKMPNGDRFYLGGPIDPSSR